MRKLVALIFLTLDGVMQGPGSPEEDPSDGFTQGGWAKPYWDEVMQHVMKEAMAEPYDLLIGRKTYELFTPDNLDNLKPKGDSVAAKRLRDGHKYVVSSSPNQDLPWKAASIITGDIQKEILKLKEQDGPLLQIHGSHNLIQTLLKHNLIDEFRLWAFPVVLGSGKRLFIEGVPRSDLKLIKSGTTPNGVVMGIYQRKNLS